MSIANLSQNAEITQSGQALRINLSAYNSLARLFEGSFGSKGTSKMLINQNSIKILKDGRSLIDNIYFIHPIVNLINKSAKQSHDLLGDGVTTFILFGNILFNEAIKNLQSAVKVNEQVMTDLYKMKEFLEQEKIQFNFDQEIDNIKRNLHVKHGFTINDSCLLNVIFYFLNTKMDESLAKFFSKIVISSFNSTRNMTEILSMDGDVFESNVVDGLVMDHSGRHPSMPRLIEDCYIIISNMVLEYEKTEINSQLMYKNVEERNQMFASERVLLNKKIDRILQLKEQASKQGKKLVFFTERGIDLPSLDRLSSMLCLRRVKRKNLERLLRLCGGKIVTSFDDLVLSNCGYVGKISVVEEKDQSYTFLTKTPYKGSKTVLLHGYNQYEKERIKISLQASYKILENLKKQPFLIKGGPSLYFNLSKRLENVNQRRTPVSETLFKMGEKLEQQNVGLIEEPVEDEKEKDLGFSSSESNESYLDQPSGESKGIIYDSFVTIDKTLFNSGAVTSTLLLVDEIIKAGKSVKEGQDQQ